MVVEEVSKPAAKNTKAWAAREFIDRPTIRTVKCIIEASHILKREISDHVFASRWVNQSDINQLIHLFVI
jgi:hypothetical protein